MESESEFASPDNIKAVRKIADLTYDQAAAVIDVSERTWRSWERGERHMKTTLLEHFKTLFAAQALLPNYVHPKEVKSSRLTHIRGMAKVQAKAAKAGTWAPGQPLPVFVPPPLSDLQKEVDAYEAEHGMGSHPTSKSTPEQLEQLQREFEEGLAAAKLAETAKAIFLST